MNTYLSIPVLDEIREGILILHDRKILTDTQAVVMLNLIKEKVENYNSDQKDNNTCRCGRCLRHLSGVETFSLEEEVNKITKGSWWSEELETEAAFDTICAGCLSFIINKYFCCNKKGRKE